MFRTTIACLCLILLCGCSEQLPSESEVRGKVEESLVGFGPLKSFTKTNGEKLQIGGRDMYILYYEASVQLGDGFYYRSATVLQGAGIQQGKELGMLGEGATLHPISAGSTMLLEGQAAYRLTDNGWIFHESSTKRLNYCDASNNIDPCSFANIDKFLAKAEEARKKAEAAEKIRRPGAGMWFESSIASDRDNSVNVRDDLCIEMHIQAMDGKDNALIVSSFDSQRNLIDERSFSSVGEVAIFHGPVYLVYKGRLRLPNKVRIVFRQWFKSEKGCPA